MQTLNIYLETKDKQELIRLKNKYHLSFSTIAQIVTDHYATYLGKSLEEKYFYDKKGTKTSIKPRQLYNFKKPSIVYDNCINIFLKKDLKKYLDKHTVETITNKIYSKFQNTFDDNWNGNQLSRFIPKFFKNNPEYTKKLLKIE